MAELAAGILSRISEQVQRLPGRNQNQPVEFTPSLGIERQYANLGRVYNQFDRLIPNKGLEEWHERKRVAKEKEFKPKDAVRNVRKALQSHFPDPTQQGQVVEAVGIFLQTMITHIEPGSADTPVFSTIDRFLAGFPANMFNYLGEDASSDRVVQIFQLGSKVLKLEAEHRAELYADLPPSAQRADAMNWYFGPLALLVGESIPEILARPGIKQEETLAHLESASSMGELNNLVDYYKKVKEPSPEIQAKIAKLKLTVENIDPTMGSSTSPFNQASREPWRDERVMGNEQIIPTWGDLAAMVWSGEQDRREYGIAVSRNTSDMGDPYVEYLRGGERSIYNGARRRNFKENIFFHSHPSINEEREIFAPLVSTGDLTATIMQDYGGAYLNVVSLSGLSIHIGSVAQETRNDKVTYAIESGEFKGSSFRPGEGITEKIMRDVKNTKAPYLYSITDEVGVKQYFLHLPWEQIAKSADFYDVCFGEGLQRILSSLDGVEALPEAQNLHEALRTTFRVHHEVAKKSLEMRKPS